MLREGPIRRVRPRVYSVMRCRVSKFGGSGKRISGCTVRARSGDNFDFLFRATRDKVAARCFFEKLIAQNGAPETVTIDKSGSNLAALHAVNAKRETPIKIRQIKYLNNVIEQDHRAIKRITRPMLGFKDFDCARVILSGIEVMHMIKKGQMKCSGKIPPSAAQQFYSLVS